MDPEAAAKRAAADAAVELIENGMTVGIGSGTTARWFIDGLAARIRSGIAVRAVPTSNATATLASRHGISLTELDRSGVDVAVDGADAVDPDLRLIKGRGGAMVRERVVAAAARRLVVIVDEGKRRTQLGGSVPVELIAFGVEHTLELLSATGASFLLRTAGDGSPLVTDNGNLIADGSYPPIDDAEGLAERLDAIPGLVGHGLFLGMTDLVLVGHADGRVHTLTPHR